MRYRRKIYGILLVVLAALLPLGASAQQSRRWLADPELITTAKVIGGDGRAFRETRDTVADIDVLDANTGWAVSYGHLLQYDGRWWKPTYLISSGESLSALDMRSATDGWAVGSTYAGIDMPQVILFHYDGTSWQPVREVIRKDGTRGVLAGGLSDVAVLPDGTAIAVGGVYDLSVGQFGQRALILQFDGTSWRDTTPDAWLSGGSLRSVSMLSAADGYIAGILGVPGGTGANAVRPAIARLQSGTWAEQPLPTLPISGQPFSMYGLSVRPDGVGYAIFYDAGTRCPNTALLSYAGGAWSVVPRSSYGDAPITAFALIPGTTQGWATQSGCQGRGERQPDRRLRYDSGTFTVDTTGAQVAPSVYALVSPELQFAAAGGAMLRWSDERLPTERREPNTEADGRNLYFRETGHYIVEPEFLRYYQTHGLELGDRGISARESLALFGYPVSEAFQEINPDTGAVLQVQYFERARFEYHRENQGTPYVVLLGRLGANTLLRLGRSLDSPPATPAAACQTFAETPFQLCPPFRDFWNRGGGLAVFGFPISTAADEQSRTDGRTYATQWFERERLEAHPENAGTPYSVLLGLLASEELQARGYLPR